MTCHVPAIPQPIPGGTIALVGHSNVGKSALFQKLTGLRVIVSNYPGTTVETLRGQVQNRPDFALLDTPGVVALPANSEDERLTARVLLEEPLSAVLQVGDAKNLPKTLALTLQLAELGLPLALALNMMDEATQRGLTLDLPRLAETLGIPVVATVAVRNRGLEELLEHLPEARPANWQVPYPAAIETALEKLAARCPEGNGLARRGLAVLALCHDPEVHEYLGARLPAGTMAEIAAIRAAAATELGDAPAAVIQSVRWAAAEALAAEIQQRSRPQEQHSLRQRLEALTLHPVWGPGILLGVLAALFWFVGVVGAQWLVGLLEENLFGEIINPFMADLTARLTPLPWLQALLVGEYGLWTMGVTYAVALILPIVTTFFIAFGALEDSGYLPRLAVLSNRAFSALGLNGKAVLPMVLGLGCVTMATVTTRTLETRRERFLVTLLLALAMPCSAQLGVMMGLLASVSLGASLIWVGAVLVVLLVVGWLAARLLPGERQPLVLELPPLRWPLFSAILVKTLARLEWYMKEVLPMFLLGAFVMFLLDQAGGLAWLITAAEPLTVSWLGLPAAAAPAFVLGFMRRDFGATGFFLLNAAGALTPAQTVVAMVTITLFIPCIASVMIIAKEHGSRVAAGMTALIFPLAFLVGGLLQRLLALVGFGG